MIKRMRGEQGFTLIELLVVIVIIGLLLAVALPSFLGQTNKAKESAAKQELRQAYTAAKTYAAENAGSYTGLNDAAIKQIEPSVENVTVDEDATDGGDLKLDYSKDGVTGSLTVQGNGAPSISVTVN